MTFSREYAEKVAVHLYRTDRTSSWNRVSHLDLSSELQSSTSFSERNFREALKHMKDNGYLEEDIASYWLTPSGSEYSRQLVGEIINYQEESFHYQRRNFQRSGISLFVGVAGVVIAAIGHFLDLRIDPHNFQNMINPRQNRTVEDSPSQSILRYWKFIEAHRYEESWGLLSEEFHEYYGSLGNTPNQKYIEGFESAKICSIETKIVSQNKQWKNYTIVTAQLDVKKGDNCLTSEKSTHNFYLFSDENKSVWLIDCIEGSTEPHCKEEYLK